MIDKQLKNNESEWHAVNINIVKFHLFINQKSINQSLLHFEHLLQPILSVVELEFHASGPFPCCELFGILRYDLNWKDPFPVSCISKSLSFINWREAFDKA